MDPHGNIKKELEIVRRFRAETDRAMENGEKVEYSNEELAEIIRAINIVNERCRSVNDLFLQIDYTKKFKN